MKEGFTCKDCVEYNPEINWCEILHKSIPLDWIPCKRFNIMHSECIDCSIFKDGNRYKQMCEHLDCWEGE